MAIDKSALLADLEKTGVDMTKAQEGGGEYAPPAAGPVWLRLFAYIEVGKHNKKVKGVDKVTERVLLGFELSGPNHPPKEDGTPQVMWIDENKSLNPKANFFKLFSRLNHAGKAKHPLGLIGEAYLGKITHNVVPGKDGGKPRTFANLRSDGPYDIGPASFMNPMDGAVTVLPVPALRKPEQVFLWDRPDLEQWASIFIEGEYPAREAEDGKPARAAQSKNVTQARIMKALNFKGSPTELMLLANGKPLDIPNAELPEDSDSDDGEVDAPAEQAKAPAQVPTGQAAADALSGIV